MGAGLGVERCHQSWSQSPARVGWALHQGQSGTRQSQSLLHQTVLELVSPQPTLPSDTELVSVQGTHTELGQWYRTCLEAELKFESQPKNKISVIIVTWDDNSTIEISSVSHIRGNQRFGHVGHSWTHSEGNWTPFRIELGIIKRESATLMCDMSWKPIPVRYSGI